jgi:predicted enzyme related to lactoylglutathione lyase
MKTWVTWFEIPVTDMARAKAFYESIFAFKLADLEPGQGLKMALFPGTQDGMDGSGSLIQMASFYKPGETGPLIYLNADPDLAVVMGRVEKAGGKVIFPKRQISPERGFMGVFSDTEGNRIALHSKA